MISIQQTRKDYIIMHFYDDESKKDYVDYLKDIVDEVIESNSVTMDDVIKLKEVIYDLYDLYHE